MPTYEYVCTSCGTHVDVYQRFSEDPLTVCGVCGGQLRKVFHPAGILFKGSGFYATDSRAKSRGKAGGDGEKRETATEKAGASAGSASSGDGGGSTSTGEGGGSTSTAEGSASNTGGSAKKGQTGAKRAKERSA
jgi:putative FmdB family regulatory protein